MGFIFKGHGLNATCLNGLIMHLGQSALNGSGPVR